jgi:benzoylformate decarboxylase
LIGYIRGMLLPQETPIDAHHQVRHELPSEQGDRHMLGIEALLDILASARVRYIFGNPGSTELPLSDVLARDARFQYIFGLHELPATAMADGYAMASGQVGVVCVHIACGLGNAMGMLYNAHRAGTPLLLLAGQQDRRLRWGEPVLEGDLVGVARPWTKWAVEVQRVEDVPLVVRRAVQTALTPPTGPVFLSLPVDVQLENLEQPDLTRPCIPDRRVRPPLGAVRQAAEILSQARNPAILAGSRVTEADAVAELVALAEQLGAPVLSESTTSHGRLPMPADHPLYAGPLPLWSPDIRQRLADYDVILAVGLNVLRLYIYREPACPIPEHVRLIQLDANPWELGKNYAVEVGLLGDPQAGLAELSQHIAKIYPADQAQAAVRRREAHAAQRASERESLLATIKAQRDQRPMTSLTFMGALARVLPPNTAVVEEAVTTHRNVLERLGVLRDPSGHFAQRGWALGWGLGCAIGVKLAWPERPVVALVGDGAALYGIQALWTAAHHHIPVTFVIANNAQYKVLKDSGNVMALPQMALKNYLAMDLVEPEVDFVGLARSFGVEAQRVTEPDELSERVGEALYRTKPLLLEVVIER